MTNKIYKTAQGQSIDLGAILLKNEHVRAVGNMNVNARGDLLDGSNRVIDQRNQQVARQLENTTQPAPITVSNKPLHSSTVAARRSRETPDTVTTVQDPVVDAPVVPEPDPVPVSEPAPVDLAPVESSPVDLAPTADTPVEPPLTGLAAAMARSRTVTQEKLKTPKEIAKTRPGVNRL